jgi:hypothetical protein
MLKVSIDAAQRERTALFLDVDGWEEAWTRV